MLIKCQGWSLTHLAVVFLFWSRAFLLPKPSSAALSLLWKLLPGAQWTQRPGARGWGRWARPSGLFAKHQCCCQHW